MITKVNPYGHISLTNDYFSGLVEQAAKQCYGIAAMGQAPAESEFEARICRRYREGASALARDNVKGWRSGRLDRVLAGEFDVVE